MPWLLAVVAFLKALLGIKPTDPVVEEARKNEAQAEKNAAAFAAPDRNRAAVDDILRSHADE